MADDVSGIEHSFPIVFSRHMKCRQIVNCGDAWTGSAPHHAPITRDMQHVEAMPTRELRQNGLMPKNVANRRTKTFRDGNQFHPVANEIEERKVMLEHEENK